MSHIHRSPAPTPLSHPQMPAQSISATSANRQKSKTYATGIAAGVEDEKYQTKYKELKRKVREIETVCNYNASTFMYSPVPTFRTMTSCTTRSSWPKNQFNV
jgi:hypothetical protein